VEGTRAGVEFGGLGPREEIKMGVGVGSANGYYHLSIATRRNFDPFVTGGYSVLWKMGHLNLGNMGIGTNYWLARHFGLRVEARDHIYTSPSVHYWGIRVGLAIR